MMQLLEAIEGTGFAIWVRESPSLFSYTFILSLHAIGLAIVVGINSIVALRLLGFAPGIPLAPALKLFPAMYIGFWINAISGLMLLSANATGMLTAVIFYIKIAFIALAIVALRLTRNQVFADPSGLDIGPVPARAKQLAIASLVCWTGAIIAGRLTAYPYFVEAWFGI